MRRRVHFEQILLELSPRCVEKLLRLRNALLCLKENFIKVTHIGNLEALAHEGIANFLDAISVASSGAENNEVSNLGDVVLLEILEVGQSLASGDSKEHLLHALHLFLSDSTSNKLQGALNLVDA